MTERAWLRRVAVLGAAHGPGWWHRRSPPWFGLLALLLCPVARRRVRQNLRLLVGRRAALTELWDVARTFVAYSHTVAEQLGVNRPEAVHATLEIEGKEHLDRLLETPSGFVIATAHTAAFDVVARRLGTDTGRSVVVVMQAEGHADAQRLHQALRASESVAVMYVGNEPRDAIGLVAHLRGGGLVALQLDRSGADERAVDVAFARGRLRLPRGPLQLAATAGVPILPLFVSRSGSFAYRLRVGAPVDVPRRPSRAELLRAAECLSAELERHLLAHPTEWFHFAP